jgi:phosphoglycolate phosphatase
MKTELKVIFFDFDGTLVNLPIDYEKVREELKELFSEYKIVSEFRPLLASIEELSKKVPKEPNLEKRALSILDKFEIESLENATPNQPGIDMYLKFKKEGKTIVIVTRNCHLVVEMALNKFNIPMPKMILGRDDVDYVKPDERHIGNVMKTLRIKPEECMIIGDSDIDIELGKRTHVKAVKI